MREIVPTVVPHDRAELHDAVRKVSSFSKKIHVDIDDGRFVAQLTWPYTAVNTYNREDIASPEGIEIEAHLMVSEPLGIGVDLIRAGVRTVIGHIEAMKMNDGPERIFATWRSEGATAIGLAVLMSTPLERIIASASVCDFIQIMGVATIGAQGAPFDPRAIERVRTLRATCPNVVIAVDGGVSPDNIAALVSAGATRFAVGSAIMHASDPVAAYQLLCTRARS